MRHWPHVIRVQGGLRADEQAVVGAKVAGRVKDVHVDIGAVVRRGDVLMGLDTEDLNLNIQQAEAQLAQVCARLGLTIKDDEGHIDPEKVPAVQEQKAFRDEAAVRLRRTESLVELRALSAEDFDERKTALAVAEAKYQSALNAVTQDVALVRLKRAQLALARQTIEDAAVRAPFDGIIEERRVSPGVYVEVGQAVVTLVRNDPVRFCAGVPERDAVQLKIGQEVRIRVEGHGGVMVRPISRISPALTTANRSLGIEVDIPNPGGELRAGLFVEAKIVVDPDAKTLALPTEAVSDFAGVEKVWVVKNGVAEPRSVRTGRHDEKGWIEIVDGLSAGEMVALDTEEIRPGPVVVEKEGEPATPVVQKQPNSTR
jgi:RND family efflux transporter MFP subunit